MKNQWQHFEAALKRRVEEPLPARLEALTLQRAKQHLPSANGELAAPDWIHRLVTRAILAVLWSAATGSVIGTALAAQRIFGSSVPW